MVAGFPQSDQAREGKQDGIYSLSGT